jgi:hypothetical protein
MAAMLAVKLSKNAERMFAASENVVAFRHDQHQHRRKRRGINMLKRVNIKTRGVLCHAMYKTPYPARQHCHQRLNNQMSS